MYFDDKYCVHCFLVRIATIHNTRNSLLYFEGRFQSNPSSQEFGAVVWYLTQQILACSPQPTLLSALIDCDQIHWNWWHI